MGDSSLTHSRASSCSKLPHSHSTPVGVDGGGGGSSRTPPTTPKKGGKMLAIRVQMLDDSVTMFQVQVSANFNVTSVILVMYWGIVQRNNYLIILIYQAIADNITLFVLYLKTRESVAVDNRSGKFEKMTTNNIFWRFLVSFISYHSIK